MTVYCIGYARNLNTEALKEYGKHAADALKQYGGALVSKSASPTILDGETASDLAIILSFPSEENALGWRNDPELAAVHDLRGASGDWRIELLAS